MNCFPAPNSSGYTKMRGLPGAGRREGGRSSHGSMVRVLLGDDKVS